MSHNPRAATFWALYKGRVTVEHFDEDPHLPELDGHPLYPVAAVYDVVMDRTRVGFTLIAPSLVPVMA